MSTEIIQLESPRLDWSKRKYSDIEKASALITLDSNGGNLFRTSQELQIPRKTLESWAKDRAGNNWSVAEMRQENTKSVADMFEGIVRKYLTHADDPFVIASTTGRDAIFAAAIATDKMQLLRGLPTSITENVERNELTVILAGALEGALDLPEVIDVTPDNSST